ncbi:hypothetical protein [Parabacteroides sp. PF5-9]|uniref:hypothetical protein n=1 Tax=Parabacteroides sp. PF5-9 TaxID=1742404 RepID=UPI0024742F84|nr:hypothetical protein [Parabacteroides sp. PF5-9]MDH6356197.1 hypothetical protein [Parabacteroides sp. PF5-9]
MKKLFIIILFFFRIPTLLFPENNLRIGDIRPLSMGGNGVTQSIVFNPTLVALSERSIRFQYYNKYGLKELSHIQASFLFPNTLLPVGFQAFSFGYDAYRESMFRFIAGKKLNEQWTLGVAVQYTLLQTELFEERPSSLSTDIGSTFSPVENLLIGLLIMHLPSISFGDQNTDKYDFTDYAVQFGMAWEIINSLLITAYLGTEEEERLIGGIGVEYKLFDDFYIRSGIETKPLTPAMGVGYNLSVFTVDVVATWHEVLGVSSGIGLTFSF